jgi:hypothetical protein
VDGNPADVQPYISYNGNVKYLAKGHLKIGIGNEVAARKYQGNTGYVMYNDTAYDDNHVTGHLIDVNSNYVFAMPIGANSTQPHTWKYQRFWTIPGGQTEPGWTYFTPDDNKDLVVGEMRTANNEESGLATSPHEQDKYLQIESIEAYQMARKPSVVRESYNFTITPDDFMTSGGMEGRFFANAAFWASPEGMDATFIYNLVADRIQTGTLTAGVTVGAEDKITIDGRTSRIVIKD